jgi:hypothetical protein
VTNEFPIQEEDGQAHFGKMNNKTRRKISLMTENFHISRHVERDSVFTASLSSVDG